MAAIEDRVREAMSQVILETTDRKPSRLKASVQTLVESFEDSDLSSYLMWCNSRGIRAVLEREPTERCASALADLCEKSEYATIAARALNQLDEEKRIAILSRWRQAGEDQSPYRNGIRCLSAFNENKMREWNPEGATFQIPDEYVYLGTWPREFPDSARRCVFCHNDYGKWQLLYHADCDYHTFHEICEMKDDRDKGILEGVCSSCNGGGYQSRDELASELRDRLLQEQRHGNQP